MNHGEERFRDAFFKLDNVPIDKDLGIDGRTIRRILTGKDESGIVQIGDQQVNYETFRRKFEERGAEDPVTEKLKDLSQENEELLGSIIATEAFGQTYSEPEHNRRVTSTWTNGSAVMAYDEKQEKQFKLGERQEIPDEIIEHEDQNRILYTDEGRERRYSFVDPAGSFKDDVTGTVKESLNDVQADYGTIRLAAEYVKETEISHDEGVLRKAEERLDELDEHYRIRTVE